jgi:hypothetical protein
MSDGGKDERKPVPDDDELSDDVRQFVGLIASIERDDPFPFGVFTYRAMNNHLRVLREERSRAATAEPPPQRPYVWALTTQVLFDDWLRIHRPKIDPRQERYIRAFLQARIEEVIRQFA